MKQTLLTIFLSLSANFIFSQGITIRGHVTSNDLLLPVSNASVIASFNDSITGETLTDSNGFYQVHLKNRTSIKLSIHKFKIKRCGRGETYMSDRNVIDLSNTKDSMTVTRDFILERFNSDWELPILCFNKNATSPDTCIYSYDDEKMDSALFCLVEVLRADPLVHVSINGYAESNEKDPDKLSTNRAIAAKNILLKFSVDKKRMEVHGRGTEEPIIHMDNDRIVTFSILKK